MEILFGSLVHHNREVEVRGKIFNKPDKVQEIKGTLKILIEKLNIIFETILTLTLREFRHLVI